MKGGDYMDIKILKGLLGIYQVYINGMLVIDISPWKNLIITVNDKFIFNLEDIVSIHIKKK